DRPGDLQVGVEEVVMIREVEVIVGDVAAAGQHGGFVDDQELAVRAVLDADQPVDGAGVVVAHFHAGFAEKPTRMRTCTPSRALLISAWVRRREASSTS